MPRVLVLPGDGIGPEVTAEARAVLEVVAPDVEIEEARIGGCAIDEAGTPLPDDTLERARVCGLVLLGAVGGPKWDPLPPESRPEKGLLRIRKELDLYANLRPVAVLPALVDASSLRPEVVKGVDLIVVRELTGGIYFGDPRGRDDVNGLRRARNTMAYEPGGLRVKLTESTGTKKFIWDDQNYLAETDENDDTQVVYTNEPRPYGNLVSQRRGTERHWYHFDAIGSTRKVTDTTEVVSSTKLYDAWGNIVATTGAVSIEDRSCRDAQGRSDHGCHHCRAGRDCREGRCGGRHGARADSRRHPHRRRSSTDVQSFGDP